MNCRAQQTKKHKGFVAECAFVCEKYILIIAKEEENSPFSAHGAVLVLRKREFSSSFALCMRQKQYLVTVPYTKCTPPISADQELHETAKNDDIHARNPKNSYSFFQQVVKYQSLMKYDHHKVLQDCRGNQDARR